jgi:hypothetical protein
MTRKPARSRCSTRRLATIQFSGQRPDKSARFRRELGDANGTPPRQWRQGAPASIDLLTALRGPGDSYGDVIIRLAKDDGREEWIARQAEAKLGAIGLRRFGEQPSGPALGVDGAGQAPRPGGQARGETRAPVWPRVGEPRAPSRYKYLNWSAPVAVHAAVIRQFLYFMFGK